jgi:acetyl-CoA carboxylase/biotin carboxylase 1
VGSTRESARKHLILALRDLTIYGAIRTTTQYLIAMLELEDYKDNLIDTQWLDGLIANKSINSRVPEGADKYLTVVFGAVVKANAALTQLRNEAITALDYGRVPHDALLCTTFPVELILDAVKYSMTVRTTGQHDFAVELNGSVVNTTTHPLSDGRLLVFADGKTSTVFHEMDSTGLRLEIGNKGYTTVIFENENDPTKLRATTTGKLVRFLVADGDHVEAGQAFCEMEVMKMYMQLTTSHAGVLSHAANGDSYVKAGDIIAHMDLDDKSSVSTAELYRGKLPPFKAPHMLGTRCHHKLREALSRANAIMAGFADPHPEREQIHSEILAALSDQSLAFHEIQEAFTTVRSSLPTNVGAAIEETLFKDLGGGLLDSPGATPVDSHSAAAVSPSVDYVVTSVHRMLAILEAYQGDSRIKSLLDVLRRHAEGRGPLVWRTFHPFLAEYVRVEGKFSGMLNMHEQVVMEMVREAVDAETGTPGLTVREQRNVACGKVFKALVSHEQVTQKSRFIANTLNTLSANTDFLRCFPSTVTGINKENKPVDPDKKSPHLTGMMPAAGALSGVATQDVFRLLRAMEDLRGAHYSEVALRARQAQVLKSL